MVWTLTHSLCHGRQTDIVQSNGAFGADCFIALSCGDSLSCGDGGCWALLIKKLLIKTLQQGTRDDKGRRDRDRDRNRNRNREGRERMGWDGGRMAEESSVTYLLLKLMT